MAAQKAQQIQSRTVVLALVVLVLGLGLGETLLSVDFGGGYLLERLQYEGEKTLGCRIAAARISGNPLGGYVIHHLELSRDGVPILTAETFGLVLDPWSLLQGNPIPKFLDMENMTVDGTRFLPVLRSLDIAPRETPTPSLRWRRVRITLDDHTLEVDRFTLERRHGAFSLRAAMTLNACPLDFQGVVDTEGERFLLSEGIVALGQGSGTLAGTLAPELDLTGTWKGFRLQDFPVGLSFITSDDQGTFEGHFSLQGPFRNPRLSGDLMAKGRYRGMEIDSGTILWQWSSPLLRVAAEHGRVFETPWKGDLSLDFSLPTAPTLEARITAFSVDLTPWKPLFSPFGDVRGTVRQIDLRFRRTSENPTGRTFLQGLSLDAAGWTITDGRVLADFTSRSLDFSGSVRWLGAPGKISGTVDKIDRIPILSADLALENLPLERLAEVFPDLRSQSLEGRAVARIALTGHPRSPDVRGIVTSERLVLWKKSLERFSGSFSLQGSRFDIPQAEAFWKGSRLLISGTIDDWFGAGRYALRGVAERVNASSLTELVPSVRTLNPGGRGTVQWTLEGSFHRPVLHVSAKGLGVSLKGIPLGSLALEGSWSGRAVALNKCEGTLPRGSWTLGGTMELGTEPLVNLRGTLQNVALQPFLAALSSEKSSDARLSGSFSFKGPMARPLVETSLSADQLRGWPLELRDARGDFVWQNNHLKIHRFRASGVDTGIVSLRGTVTMGPTPAYTVEGTLDKLNLQSTQSFLGEKAGVFLRGALSGTLSADGLGNTLRCRFRGSVPKFSLNGFSFTDITGCVETDGTTLRLEEIRGNVGSGTIMANLNAALSSTDRWDTTFSIQGDRLDIARLFPSLGDPGAIQGHADVQIQGAMRGGSLTGQGTLLSPSLRVYGFLAHRLRVPLHFSGTVLSVDNATAHTYGGTLKASGRLNTNNASWKARGQLLSIDIASALRDTVPLSGDVFGTGNLRATISGRLGDLYATEADASLEAFHGRIAGFSATEAMASATEGGHEVPFASIRSTISVNGRVLYILPGSRMASPPGDGSYRYLMVDGAIPLAGRPMNLNCFGEINARALNAFLGALSGLMTAAQNTENLVQDVLLGGLVGGMARRDFRQVSFKIKGPLDAPILTDLNVSGKAKGGLAPPPLPGDAPNATKNTTTDEISLTLSFPTGKGASQSDDVENQIQQQLLEQLLKRVIPGGTSPAPAQP